MDKSLNALEIRVLGTLIEKESTTPEYYPMSLNSLAAACNQKTSRLPVTDYTEGDVLAGLELLRSRGYAAEISGSGRVNKYGQRFTEKLNLGRRETALLSVLMLRGPQTAGEIKGRTERMYSFSDLDEVDTVLRKLIERPEGALVQRLAPMPGMKEPRYAQTLGGSVESLAPQASHEHAAGASMISNGSDRLGALEAEVAQLRAELEELRRRFDQLVG